MTIETTILYWDCECDKHYIHPRSHKTCVHCKAVRDEQPDSRVNEVRDAGLSLLVTAFARANTHSRGTASCWFHTELIEKGELEKGFYERFPNIKSIMTIDVSERELVNGFKPHIKHYNFETPTSDMEAE